jgi:hypothetical protein
MAHTTACTVALLLLSALPTLRAQTAGPKWAESWEKCVAAAKADNKSIFLVVTATQWNPESQPFLERTICSESVVKLVESAYHAFRIDLPLKPDKKMHEELLTKHRQLLKSLGFRGIHSLPRVVLLEPDLHVYGRIGPVGDANNFLRWVREWEEARKLTRLPVVDSVESDTCQREAVAARNLKNPTKALEWAKKGVAANPQSPNAHYTLALTHQDSGHEKDARAGYFAALSIDSTGNPLDGPSTIWAAGGWYNLGVVASKEKRPDELIFCMWENQRTDLRTDGPHRNLADVFGQEGRKEALLEVSEDRLARDPFSPEWLRQFDTQKKAVLEGK